MKTPILLLVGSLAVILAGCGGGPKSSGSMASAFTGGLVEESAASRRSSSSIATWLGSWADTDLARQLDDKDRQLASEAEYEALESGGAGVAREWRNGSSGRRGAVTPGPAYSVNQYTCRDYVDVIAFESRQEVRRGTACRQPDGSWRPIS